MQMTSQEDAFFIVETLSKAGYIAYFAGGWVRDFLLKHPSDDIDIATNAPPEVVMSLFKNTVPVGIAFGIVIVVIKGHPYEVASFRRDIEYIGGRRPEKIELSTPQEDAYRRDFTINGMFYDPLQDVIIDYVHGKEDLARGVIRTIGSPHERFAEDRLRMVRAIRFASRFGFEMDPETQHAIQVHANTLFPAVAMERVWQEFHKMAKFPGFDFALVEMHRLGLLSVIFPALENLELEMIQQRVANFKAFPKETPTILYLMELFPNLSLKELLQLCEYLKTSGHEGSILEFAHKGRTLLEKEEIAPEQIETPEWVKFYADRFFQAYFNTIATGYSKEQKEEILQRHQKRHEALKPHIKRVVEKKPLVSAAVLQAHGILPGKKMGALMKEAEQIAIKYDLHDPEEVIALLKQNPLWNI